MTSSCGRPKPEISLFICRLNTSLMSGGEGVRYAVLAFVPSVSSFSHVYAPCTLSPCENRLVTLACSESYQVLPSGGPRNGGMPSHCGYGRSAWPKGWVAGNPG